MSTSKLDKSGVFGPMRLTLRETHLTVPYRSIRFRKNGVEFASEQAFALWTEVVIDLRSSEDGRRIRGAGVVVDCRGQNNGAHWISVLLLELSNSAASHLAYLASEAQLV